jgi:hypothetical protein
MVYLLILVLIRIVINIHSSNIVCTLDCTVLLTHIPVDEGMPNESSIFAYLVFDPGGRTAKGIARPIH